MILPGNTQAMRALWQKVILQAVRDAVSMKVTRDSEHIKAKRSARSWLDGTSSDFNHVCTMAGLEPDRVRSWWRSIRNDSERLEAISRRFRDTANG